MDLYVYGPLADRTAFLGWLEERPGARILSIMPWSIGRAVAVGLETLVADPAGHADGRGRPYRCWAGSAKNALATEAQYLLARYVFETPGIRRYDGNAMRLKCRLIPCGAPFGFAFEGVFRNHNDQQGPQPRQRLVRDDRYGLAGRKAAFERWLAPTISTRPAGSAPACAN